jgi:hypothetical protein
MTIKVNEDTGECEVVPGCSLGARAGPPPHVLKVQSAAWRRTSAGMTLQVVPDDINRIALSQAPPIRPYQGVVLVSWLRTRKSDCIAMISGSKSGLKSMRSRAFFATAVEPTS